MMIEQLYLAEQRPPRESGKGLSMADDAPTLLQQALSALEDGACTLAADAARLALAGTPTQDRLRGWATCVLGLAQLADHDVPGAWLYLRLAGDLAQQGQDAELAAAVVRSRQYALLCQAEPAADRAEPQADASPAGRAQELTDHFRSLLDSARQGVSLRSAGARPPRAPRRPVVIAESAAILLPGEPAAVAAESAASPVPARPVPVPSVARARRSARAWLVQQDGHAWSLGGYLLLIVLAEVVTAITSPALGVTLHALILALIPFHFALARQQQSVYAPLILTLALAPLIRIMSLTLPLARLPFVTWYIIIAVPLFAAAFVVSRALGLTRAQVGLTVRARDLPRQALIALTGFVLGVIEFLILRPAALVPAGDWALAALTALILLVGTGLLEEVIFRGVMQQVAQAAAGRRGLIYVSLIFAALHIGYLSVIDLLFVFGVGLLFGWLVQRTGSLLGVVIAHGLTNTLLYLVMPTVGLTLLPFLR